MYETWLESDLKKPMKVKQLQGNLFSADDSANLIGVEVFDDGEAATLSGTVYGYIIRADGTTVIEEGTLDGNKASIVLPHDAYTVVGQVNITIKVGAVTVGACVAYVYRTTTDTLIDAGDVIPDLAELLEQIEDCEEATDAANDAADAANDAATNIGNVVAPVFVQATANDPETYVMNEGKLYFLPNGHTANTTWANTTKTETKVMTVVQRMGIATVVSGDDYMITI